MVEGTLKGLDFVALDVETANQARSSICSIGLVKFIDGVEVDSFYSLINPEEYFSNDNVKVHGIKEEEVADSPKFPEIRSSLINFIGGLPVVAHNASFDFSVLKHVYEKYEIDFDKVEYFCTYRLSQIIIKDSGNYDLKTLSSYFKISLDHHHALSDARACGLILVELMKLTRQTTVRELTKKCGYDKLGLLGIKGFTTKNKVDHVETFPQTPPEKETVEVDEVEEDELIPVKEFAVQTTTSDISNVEKVKFASDSETTKEELLQVQVEPHCVNKWVYILLALFLGGLGIHCFYAKHLKTGILFLLLSFTGYPILISIVQAMFALSKNPDENGRIKM